MALSELLEQRCTQFDVRGDYTVVAGPFPRKDNRAEGHSLHPVVENFSRDYAQEVVLRTIQLPSKKFGAQTG